MKKQPNLHSEINRKLRHAVESVENQSGAEVVLAIVGTCSKYQEPAYLTGLVGFLAAFSVVMYLPHEFYDEYIYLISLAGYATGFAVGYFLPGVRRVLLSKKTLQQNVLLHAEATFHRNRLMETKERIGVLLFVSLFEKSAVMITDKGIEALLPEEIQTEMHRTLPDIFLQADPAEALVSWLKIREPHFIRYIPRAEDDINELPDRIEIV